MNKVIIFFLVLVCSFKTIACQYSSNHEQLIKAINDRNEMKRLSKKIAKESDNIFIGYIASIKDGSISFEDIENLKGKTEETETFQFQLQEIKVTCGGLSSYLNISIPSGEDRDNFLVYAKSGKILRINRVGAFAPAPSGYEEIEWIK